MERIADIILTPIALFSGRPLAVLLALGILSAAFLLWLFALLPAERRFVGRLLRLGKDLGAVRRSQDAVEQRFARLDEIFAAAGLAQAWRRYRSSVEFEAGVAISYADPADFFAVPHLPGHNYPKWSNTLAGVFLTVGLFFTFVGLSAALLQLGGDGHSALDPAQLKVAVEGILAVSSVKFITSIAGILAYIFWTVVARQETAAQSRAEDILLDEIRGLSTYVAPEMLLRRHLRLAETQNAQFADLAESVTSRLDAALARIGETNANVAQSAGAAFSSLWQSDVGRHFDGLGAQMAGAVAALEQMAGKVRDVESGFGGEIGRGAEQLTASSQRMIAAMEQGQANLAASLAAFDQKISAIPAALASASTQSSQDMGAALRETLDGVAQRADEAGRAGAESFFARMAEVSMSLSAAAGALTQSGAATQAHMADGAQKIADTAETSATRLTQILDAFGAAVNRLALRLDQTDNTLGSQNQRLVQAGEVVTGASKELAQAAGALQGATAPMTSATLSFRDAMTRFAEGAEKINQVAVSGDAIAAHVAGFGAQMTQSLAAFDALPEKIRAAEGGFGAEIGRSAGELAQAALRMSAGLERGQSALVATLAGFEAKMDAIPRLLAGASEQSSQDVAARMRKTLDESAAAAALASGKSADLFSARVEDIARMLDSAAARLQEASEASGEHLRASRATLAEGAAASARTVQEAAEQSADVLSRTVDTFAAAVRGLSNRLNETLAGLDAHNAKLEQAGAIVSGASHSLAAAAGSVAGAATPIAGASLALEGAVTNFSGAAEQIRNLSQSGLQVVENFERAAATAQQALGAQAENFRAVERAVAETLGELTSGVHGLGSEISRCIETYDNEIARSIGSLETALIDVGDIIDTRKTQRGAGAR